MTRYDAVNYISHGIAKRAGMSESRPVRGVDDDAATVEGRDETRRRRPTRSTPIASISTTRRKKGRIDPLIGREAEISRTIQILCRRQKNNPLFVGDPGVGKTAIAEGLAKRIVEGDVPEVLAKSTVFRARHGHAARRHALSRRFRGAPQAGDQGDRGVPRRDHVHRRDPHGDRRRRHLRRRHGCVEPAEAGAGLGHDPLHRLDHLQGIPPVLREGPGAGPPLPEDRRRRAVDPRRHRDPQGPQALFRGLPPRPLHQRCDQDARSSCRRATSTTASCPTRRSTSSTRPAPRRCCCPNPSGARPSACKEIEDTIATMARIPPKTVSKDDAEVLQHLDDDAEDASSTARTRRSRRSPRRSSSPAPACASRRSRSAATCSPAPPASARPRSRASSPRRWASS